PMIAQRITIGIGGRRGDGHAPVDRRIEVRRGHRHRRLSISGKGPAVHRHIDPRRAIGIRAAQHRRDVNACRRIGKRPPDQHRAVVFAASRRVVEQHRLVVIDRQIAPVQDHAITHPLVGVRIVLTILDPVVIGRSRAIHRD
ncbi:MAG: hypothetical protein ACK55I_41925, partial [bacterium]